MRSLIAFGILAFLVAGVAEANPFYKNRKQVYNKKKSISRVFYRPEPTNLPLYVYSSNIRLKEQRREVALKSRPKPTGPKAKNVHHFRESSPDTRRSFHNLVKF